ncbi:efflux RND transporter periplasmic adaptor subunit [Oleidesulfovibrio sp.]|uniref:efflux RND transporter periplasmic adaptor subunit n=1 Tax=Oleidesulfovibrio sp. TaxID=2909707 RepID=UPI003A86B48B
MQTTTHSHKIQAAVARPCFHASSTMLCASVFLLAMVMATFAHAASPAEAKGPAPAVTVEKVLIKDANPATDYVGRVEAIQTVDLQPRVEGYLETVNATEGGMVNAGDLLFTIEQTAYRARVNADAAAVDKARASLERARKYLQRLRSTRKSGVAAADMDAAVSDELQAKAQLQEALAALEQSKLNLGYTTISAPIHGRIGKVQVTRGNLVTPATGQLARIVQVDPIRVVFSLNEQDYLKMSRHISSLPTGEIKVSDAVVPRLLLSDGSEYQAKGRISFVDNEIDPQTGTIAIRAEFDNPKQLLLPGAYVTVELSEAKAKPRPVVPQAAVQEDKEGRYVLLVGEDNIVSIRRIVTAETMGSSWIVEKGLDGGETIIVYGLQKARVGQPVEPKFDATIGQE